jgi:PAS domain S-box-containing protein
LSRCPVVRCSGPDTTEQLEIASKVLDVAAPNRDPAVTNRNNEAFKDVNSAGPGEKKAQISPADKFAAAVEASQPNHGLFSGGGEMGALMARFDWSKSAVGPVSTWPQSLKTALRIILMSRYAMFVWWGRELVNLYNDPYRAFLGIKHPNALGKSAREVWAEIWDQIGPRTDAVLLRGESTYDEALPLMMTRHGYLEETYFTFSYSPLPDDQGKVAGLFCAVTEETEQVIGERRLRVLREIAAGMAESRTPSQVCQSAAACLANARRDLPFSLMYLIDKDGKNLTKAAETGFEGNHEAAPPSARIDADEGSVWPFRAVLESAQSVVIDDISSCFRDLPKGEWNDPPSRAILLPMAQQGQSRPAGIFVAGLNPYRQFNEDYRGFVSVLANQIAGAIANAVAFETERQRAESLAELDRAKTQFFSNVSHEFRTPLTLMLGPLEEVLPATRERLAPEQHEQLVIARRNALRLLKLVNTLLDFSRIESGRVTAHFQPTDLCTFTEDVSSVFRSAIEKAGLSFSIQCDPISELAYVDREMWEKVILNLLSNAFKFTFEGAIAVRLTQVGNNAELSISDTGTGIPEEELPRVFERFHRVEGARGRTFEGTGIGLALVQELVKLHGGDVIATSSVGKGSTFTVTVPLGKAHLPAEPLGFKPSLRPTGFSGETYLEEAQLWLPHARVAPGNNAGSGPRSLTPDDIEAKDEREFILIADDNADMREYVARLLRPSYRVHAVADGVQALEATRQLRPDLVLADVMMPRLDGFGLLRAIREDSDFSHTPVILLSARAGEESRVEGLHAGANDYLVKPFTARELLARVASHLSMCRVRSEQSIAAHRLAAIVESADDAIVSKDLNGIVTSWNRAAERIFGYTAEEMIGRSIITIIPPELHSDESRILQTIASGKRIDHFETVRVTKSGERLEVSLTISPVKDERGRIVGAAKIARDITQQKKAERALRTSERIASVGRLAATIAHEINNPLEAVTNLVYLAKETANPNEAREYLAMAEEELGRISHLTKQTLGFYRESKEATRIRIGPLLNPLIGIFAGRAKNKTVEIRSEIIADPEIYAVAGEMRQLITNLLNNSIDAVRSGGRIRVRVSAAQDWSTGRPGVRLTIADTGTGISPAVRSRLFEPFFTTKNDVGTGLGLWVCKGIVDRHLGSIQVKSSSDPENSWTVFSVFLPSDKQEPVAEDFKLAS